MNVFHAKKMTAAAKDDFTARRRFLTAIMLAGMCVLISRAFFLQVLDKQHYIEIGEAKQVSVVELPAHRGMIKDRNGNPLAVSTVVETIVIDPSALGSEQLTEHELFLIRQRELKKRKEQHSKLTGEQQAAEVSKYKIEKANGIASMETLLQLPKGHIAKLVKEHAINKNFKDNHFYVLAKNIDPERATQIKSLGLLAVTIRQESKRFYPTESVSGHLVGFTGRPPKKGDDNKEMDRKDDIDIGLAGMEAGYEQRLKGTPGKKKVLLDGQRRIIDDIESVQAPIDGQDIELSIDQRLQYLAYRELQRAVTANHAKAGTMVILDAKTGEILACANQPQFNPNNRSELQENLYRNRAITEVFEPGSTVKPFIVAAALDGHYISYNDIFHTHGTFQIGNHTVRDTSNHGSMDLTGVIKHSSNIAVSQMALRMPPQYQHSTYQRLGFGIKPGSGFEGEVRGKLSDYHHWKDFDRAVHAFGYGFNTSALQLARAYTALANDGMLHSVSILKRDDNDDTYIEPPVRVFSPQTARNVRAMMEHVVSKEGTAPEARVDGYTVAGKTGTAKKAGAHGYTENSYFSVFAGMIPAKNPRLIAVVMIDEPHAGEYYGGKVAAPVFARVMAGAMRILAVTPDKQETMPVLLTQNHYTKP